MRVALLVVGDFVLVRERIAASREADTGEAVQVAGREETQRIPAQTPGIADPRMRVDEDHLAPAAQEVVRDRESAVARADDQDIRVLGHDVGA